MQKSSVFHCFFSFFMKKFCRRPPLPSHIQYIFLYSLLYTICAKRPGLCACRRRRNFCPAPQKNGICGQSYCLRRAKIATKTCDMPLIKLPRICYTVAATQFHIFLGIRIQLWQLVSSFPYTVEIVSQQSKILMQGVSSIKTRFFFA